MPDKVIDYELLGEMIDCVKREVGLRYAVYPKLIASGKMTKEQAEKKKAYVCSPEMFTENLRRQSSSRGTTSSI